MIGDDVGCAGGEVLIDVDGAVGAAPVVTKRFATSTNNASDKVGGHLEFF